MCSSTLRRLAKSGRMCQAYCFLPELLPLLTIKIILHCDDYNYSPTILNYSSRIFQHSTSLIFVLSKALFFCQDFVSWSKGNFVWSFSQFWNSNSGKSQKINLILFCTNKDKIMQSWILKYWRMVMVLWNAGMLKICIRTQILFLYLFILATPGWDQFSSKLLLA